MMHWSFLTCAPAICGAASAFISAKCLGYSVVVAERNYVGAMTNISQEAETLEEAMGIDGLISRPAVPATTGTAGERASRRTGRG